jgi:RNA polymerase sigma-B factor
VDRALERETEAGLVRRFQAGDQAARDELVHRYLPLARRLAARYRHSSEPFEDLAQVASLALVKAVHRFDPDRGATLSTYAVPTIVGELKRHFRDRGWAVRMPRELQERGAKLSRTIDLLANRLGRSPSVAEVADRLGLDLEQALEAMEAAQAYSAISLDADDGSEDGLPLTDMLGREDPGFELVEYGAAIGDALEQMSERDRMVLHLRFVEDLTQSEIAARVGVSQMQVSRILRGALIELRRSVGERAG